MELNDTTSTDFSGFSLIDQSTEGVNEQCVNNAEQFNTVDTCLGECVTLTFHETTAYDRIMKDLTTLYNFHPNKDKTALIATTEIEGNRLTITCYNTLKIVVQGVMALSWKHTIFHHLATKLKTEERQTKSEFPTTIQPNQTLRKSKSLIAKIKDLANSSDDKYLKEMKKAKKTETGDSEYDIKLIEGWRSGTDLKTIKKKGATPVNRYMNRREIDTDETNLKQTARIQTKCRVQHEPKEKTTNSSTPKNDGKKDNERKSVSHSLHKNPSCTGIKTSTETFTKASAEDAGAQSDLLQQQVNQLEKENKKLTTKNEEQANKMSKLLDSAECLKKTLSATQVKASEQSKHITRLSAKSKELENQLAESDSNTQNLECKLGKINTSYEMLERETKDLKEKLAAKNSECLIQEEENKKLKSTIRQMKEENRKLSNELSKQKSNKDHSSCVEKGLQDDVELLRVELNQLKQQMETTASTSEVMQIRDQLKVDQEEISKLKSNLQKISKEPATSSMPDASINLQSSTSDRTTDGTSATETSNAQLENTQKPKVLILGDSVTGVLDRKRLQGKEIDLTIKSNNEARISTIKATLGSQPLKEYDAVILHMGINNISDADSPQNVLTEYTEVLSAIKAKSKCKILVSSVLPKKHDKLSRTNIDKLNELLQNYCTENSLTFINNTSKYETEDKNVNKTLYRDDIHLNSRGAAVLAKQLKSAIFNALNIKTAVNFRQAQGNQNKANHQRWNQGAHHRRPWTGYRQHWRRY